MKKIIATPSPLEAYREVMEDEADEFIADILDSFYSDARELLTTLDKTLAENDADGFVRAAHTLKSTSATVGAQRLSGLLADLEAQGKTKELTDLMPLIPQLKEAYEETESTLKELYP